MNKKQVKISSAELPIMKVLWQKGELTSPEIFADLRGNQSTLKTLLKRLVDKGAVGTEAINARNYRYHPLITEKQFVNDERKNFMKRVFDGSRKKMLLNFVKEEKITKEELEALLKLIEED